MSEHNSSPISLQVIEAENVPHSVEESDVQGKDFVRHMDKQSYSYFLFILHYYLIYRKNVYPLTELFFCRFYRRKRTKKHEQTFPGFCGRR